MAEKSDDPQHDKTHRDLTKRLSKKGLLEPETMLLMCGDEDEAECASAKEMRATWKALKQAVKSRRKEGRADAVAVRTRCLGVCRHGPLVGVRPEGCWYGRVDPDAVETILAHHLDDGPPPKTLRVDKS